MHATVDAVPFRFPIAAPFDPKRTALLAIDMQVDFCGPDGMVYRWGVDLSAMRAPIEPLRRVMDACRKAGVRIVHTRETYAPDLSDFPAARRARQSAATPGKATGDRGPHGAHLVRGEPGWDFIPELKPLPGETVIDKPGFGAFHKTDLEALLRKDGIAQLLLTGVTTNCCVASTLREAEDRGFECLVLEDCCADPRPTGHNEAIAFMKRNGIFGTVADSDALIRVLTSLPR